MTPQTAQQWIEQANLIQCYRYHARITHASCEAFQDRHDSSEMEYWKHGEYSNCPHPCKGCEHLKQRQERQSALKSRRIAPSLPMPTGETRIRQKATVICPVCHGKREVTIDRTMQPSFIANGGICRSCGRKKRVKSALDPNRKIEVKCPVCGKTRQVVHYYTRREGFTGRCSTCATVATNKKRGVSREDWKAKVDVTCPKCETIRQVQYGFTVRPDFTGLCAGCAQKAKRPRTHKKDCGANDK